MIVIRGSCNALRFSRTVWARVTLNARSDYTATSFGFRVVGLGCADCVDGIEVVVFAFVAAVHLEYRHAAFARWWVSPAP